MTNSLITLRKAETLKVNDDYLMLRSRGRKTRIRKSTNSIELLVINLMPT